MATYIVVAHRTLLGRHLLDHARELASRDPATRFHLVVPIRYPWGTWSDGQLESIARTRLDEGLAAFADAGLTVTGEIGDANPIYAVSNALRSLDFDCDGIILSTLPSGRSAWLRLDVERRLRHEFDLPLTHLVTRSATAMPASP